jgi:hypothetical protein
MWSNWWNEYWEEKPKYSKYIHNSATSSTTNPTLPDLGFMVGKVALVRIYFENFSFPCQFSFIILSPNACVP